MNGDFFKHKLVCQEDGLTAKQKIYTITNRFNEDA